MLEMKMDFRVLDSMRKTINEQNLEHDGLIKIENFKKMFYSFFNNGRGDNIDPIYDQLLPLIIFTEDFKD